MPEHHHEANRLELYKAGKLEQRRAPRAPLLPDVKEVTPEEEEIIGFKLRPEMLAIALLVAVLLVLTLVAL